MAARLDNQCQYTPEIADEVCSRMALGQSLRKICADPDMPSMRTIQYWLMGRGLTEDACASLRAAYASARETQGDLAADEIRELADKAAEEGKNSNEIQAARLQVDARKWLAERMAPKKYGTNRLELSGPDGGAIQIVASETERKL